jgi:hypothetical protein
MANIAQKQVTHDASNINAAFLFRITPHLWLFIFERITVFSSKIKKKRALHAFCLAMRFNHGKIHLFKPSKNYMI